MNVLKKSGVLLLAVLMAIGCVLPAYAAEPGIMPMYEYISSCTPSFTVLNGTGYVSVYYEGVPGSFGYASVKVEIQKKQLWGLYWKKVNIDEPNGLLTWTCADYDGYLSREYSLSSGTYRALFTIVFNGVDGTTETIQETIQG